MSRDHSCAAPGCAVVLPGYLLACPRHWRQLPLQLRTRINLAWARRRRRPDDDDATSAHLAAVVDAMEVWTS